MNNHYKDILEYVDLEFDNIVEYRRHFHMYPELSKCEYKTAEYIEKELKSFGLSTKRVKETGVYTEINGDTKGKTIILRADIDALPIQEEHECSYKSRNDGVMHACGHDSHAASLLIACKYLAANRSNFKGTVKVCFQQAEEIGYGARQFIDAGLITGDRTYGSHIASNLECGKIAIVSGANNASVDWFRIKVYGKESHVSTPQFGVDALYIASQIVVGVQALVSRMTSPMDNVLIGIGKLEAGTGYNIVAKEAIMEGTVRVISNEMRVKIKSKIEELVNNISAVYGGSASVEWEDYTSVLINDKISCEEATCSAINLFGRDNVITTKEPSLSGDDFAEFINTVPGVYAYIGSYSPNIEETKLAHHNSKLDIDENCMKVSTSMYIAYALDFLNK